VAEAKVMSILTHIYFIQRRRARARGTKFGRKPKLTDHQQREARQRLEAGDSARSIAKFLGVHHTTVLRVL
jgi:DNA invertase Pin-like site-specific DNA recombinase